jgi:hypothetical protein
LATRRPSLGKPTRMRASHLLSSAKNGGGRLIKILVGCLLFSFSNGFLDTDSDHLKLCHQFVHLYLVVSWSYGIHFTTPLASLPPLDKTQERRGIFPPRALKCSDREAHPSPKIEGGDDVRTNSLHQMLSVCGFSSTSPFLVPICFPPSLSKAFGDTSCYPTTDNPPPPSSYHHTCDLSSNRICLWPCSAAGSRPEGPSPAFFGHLLPERLANFPSRPIHSRTPLYTHHNTVDATTSPELLKRDV